MMQNLNKLIQNIGLTKMMLVLKVLNLNFKC